MKVVHVAAAAIVRDDMVLLSRRPEHVHQGGKWEFPGGKLETAEEVVHALVRELQEELDITPTSYRPLIRVHHSYTDLSVLLDVWLVDDFSGLPRGREGQLVEWKSFLSLSALDFPEANIPIVKAVSLPFEFPNGSVTDYVQNEDFLVWRSHWEAIDWNAFYEFTEASMLPVYLQLNPNQEVDIKQVWDNGGQGVFNCLMENEL